MCGVAGFLQPSTLDETAAATVARMAGAIAHRGPDHSAVWLDREGGFALAHQRLSIIDLSEAGNQPMISRSTRYVVSYNGEIYNFLALKAELTDAVGLPWRGTSDTEVLVAGIDQWGVAETLKRLNGMFALAIWDRQDRVLTLARDRMGEKPLFYGTCGDAFLFGSELKALRVHPDFQLNLDRTALRCMLRYDYVPAPLTIWQDVRKLLPGHYVEIRDGGADVREPIAYWDFEKCVTAGLDHRLIDVGQMERDLEELLTDAVAMRMISDVPLGAFLSGGIDSSLIVALMQTRSTRPVQTFTIGFREGDFDESAKARIVAEHLGTEHTELCVTPEDALAVIPALPRIWDEPFGDSSQIPTFLVSQLSRRTVKVALSGDGADELFGGYDRYRAVHALWRNASRLPLSARKTLANSLEFGRARLIAGARGRAARILRSATVEDLYHWRVSRIERPESLLRDHEGSTSRCGAAWAPVAGVSAPVEKMMYIDTLTYLPDDILTKVDRASMAVSLEVRAPFLDHRVAEFSWRVPPSQKFAGNVGKRILRAIGERYLPVEIMKQGKMGFSVPVAAWLRGPLREWAETLLEPRGLTRQGNFDARAIMTLWNDFRSGKPRHDRLLWNVLMFQAWLAEQ